MVGAGSKQLLTLSPCTADAAGNITVDTSKKDFRVMLNPSSYKHDYSIQYNTQEAFGQSGNELKFSATDPEKINFDIVLDGTGVVETDGSAVDVKIQVESLKTVVYSYDGSQHEPVPVRVLWGSLIFFGRLDTMSVDFTLFKPSGEPLRAKIGLAFSGTMSKDEEALKANRSSPDLTHVVEVRAGDSLPLLCHKIYKNPAYYPDVARVNNLSSVRGLKPGIRLRFPPLR